MNVSIGANLNLTGTLDVLGNISLAEKLLFRFGIVMESIGVGVLKITGNLVVTGDINATNINALNPSFVGRLGRGRLDVSAAIKELDGLVNLKNNLASLLHSLYFDLKNKMVQNSIIKIYLHM